MTGALALVGALLAAQIQTHPTGLKAVGLSHGRRGVRTVQILDKLREQAGMPSLDLDFARFKDLHDNATGATSLVTFSRSAASSPGTYVGSDGLIKEAAVNLALYSEEFDNPAWLKTGATVLANQAIAPDGKQTADYASIGTAPFPRAVYLRYPASGTTTISAGVSYTVSVWIRSDSNTQTIVGLNGLTNTTNNVGTIVNVTTEWQRFEYTATMATDTGFYATVGASYWTGVPTQLPAHNIYIWGAQLEEGTVATPYIKTTSQALAAPRFDHDPVTGESLGLLVEEARTNLVNYSIPDSTNWNENNVTILENSSGTADPQGGTQSSFVQINSNTSQHAIFQNANVISGDTYIYSIFVKSDGTQQWVQLAGSVGFDTNVRVNFDIINGVIGNVNGSPGYGIESAGNGWFRIWISSVATLTTSGIIFPLAFLEFDDTTRIPTFLGDNTLGFYAWGAQLEAGAFPTSYIPTAGTSLSRAADVATVEGTDFSSWYNASEGTVYAKYRSPTVATRGIVSLDDNTANEAIALQSFYSTGTQLVVTDGGTQQANTAASIITDGAAYTGVAGYKASDFAIATAGDVAIDVAGTIPTVDRMRIGVNQGGDYLNGHIARLAYWPVRKTNDVLDLISDPVANDSYQILVKTDNAGTSTSTQFTIPANAGTYSVDWGDGTTSTGLTGAQTHTYPAAGQYVIRMDGITYYRTNDGGDKLKLLDVQNWGDEAWTSMAYAYWGAANMIMSATDAPDLSGVTSLLFLFNGCSSFNQPVNHWDVSKATQINSSFRGCTLFNQPLDNWDVSNVIDMGAVFNSASSFNQPIGNWNTGKATNMNGMFVSANSFNQPIGSWDVSKVTNMGGMFFLNTAFNQPINDWDVSKATTMENMFRNATAFNQPIGDWDVSSVTNYANFMLNKSPANYSAANLDAIYNGWIANELSPAETITFGSIKYTAAGAEGKDLLERADATVAVSNAVDNGSGLVRLTTASHGLSTGHKVYIKGIVGTTEANGLHTVTVVDATTIDLQGTTFTNTYTSGGTVRTGYGWTITDGGI